MTELIVLNECAKTLTKLDYKKLGYEITFTSDDPSDPNCRLGYWTITSQYGKLSGFTSGKVICSIVPTWCEGVWRSMLKAIDKLVSIEIVHENDLLSDDLNIQAAVDTWRAKLGLEQIDRAIVEPEEIWKPVPGGNCVEASSLGRIRQFGNVLGQHGEGYQYVVGCREWGGLTRAVNRLVCMAFHPNPDEKADARYIVADKHNNRPENLMWVERREPNDSLLNK